MEERAKHRKCMVSRCHYRETKGGLEVETIGEEFLPSSPKLIGSPFIWKVCGFWLVVANGKASKLVVTVYHGTQ